MLDLFTGKIVKQDLDRKGFMLPLEDVMQMNIISKAGNKEDCTIFAIQRGNLTIMVWLKFDARKGVKVIDVKTQAW